MESVKHICDTCKKEFNRKERLEKHLVKGCFTTCKICDRKFTKVKTRKIHEKSHTFKSKRECSTCGKFFSHSKYLKNHQRNAKAKECDICGKQFCHEIMLECHKRTEHIGGNITEDDVDLNQPIYMRTGYEDDENYKDEIRAHWDEIRDFKKEGEFDIELKHRIRISRTKT